MMPATLVVILVCAALSVSCTHTTYIDLSRQQLHEKIAAGEIMQPGAHVKIVTIDGEEHDVTVSAITPNSVVGKDSAGRQQGAASIDGDREIVFDNVTIPITDIAAVEQLQVTHPVGQAAVLGGLGVGMILLWALPAAFIGAFAL